MMVRPFWTSGRYYTQPGLGTDLKAPSVSRLRVFPIDVPRAVAVDRIASHVSTLAASTMLRWAVYADDGTGAYPGALLLDTGAVGDASTAGVKEATIALTLAAGRYWVGCVPQGGNPTMRAHINGVAPGVGAQSADLGVDSSGTVAYSASGTTGAAPNPFPAAQASLPHCPAVWFRAA